MTVDSIWMAANKTANGCAAAAFSLSSRKFSKEEKSAFRNDVIQQTGVLAFFESINVCLSLAKLQSFRLRNTQIVKWIRCHQQCSGWMGLYRHGVWGHSGGWADAQSTQKSFKV